MLRSDVEGQFLILRLIPLLALLIVLGVAAWQFSVGCLGTGLFLVGIVAIVGGLGGSMRFGFSMFKVAGTAGFVLLVVGAIFYAFISRC